MVHDGYGLVWQMGQMHVWRHALHARASMGCCDVANEAVETARASSQRARSPGQIGPPSCGSVARTHGGGERGLRRLSLDGWCSAASVRVAWRRRVPGVGARRCDVRACDRLLHEGVLPAGYPPGGVAPGGVRAQHLNISHSPKRLFVRRRGVRLQCPRAIRAAERRRASVSPAHARHGRSRRGRRATRVAASGASPDGRDGDGRTRASPFSYDYD